MIDCALLGEPLVRVNGAPPPPELLWRKHLALFVYLLLAPRRASTREHLIGLLWAEKPESAARHSVREAIRHVRRAVGDDGLDATMDRVALIAPVRLDTEQLEACEASADWEGAAALVRGVPLDGVEVPECPEFELWVSATRRALAARCAHALTQCAVERLAAGRAEEAAAAAEQALALDPLTDAAVRALMSAHTVRGARGAALKAWDAFAEACRQAGAEPPRDLAALVTRLRSGRVPAPADAPAVTPSSRRTPLVGRAPALAAGMAACASAWQRPGSVALVIEGAPGVGRSRLLSELVARASLAGADVTSARLVGADAGEPSSGLLAVARGGLADAEGVGGAQPAALARLAAELPEWAERGARGVSPTDTLGQAVREVMAAAWEARPLLVAVDDAHWLDAASLGWIEQLIRDASAAPLVVALTVGAGETAVVDALCGRLPADMLVRTAIEPLTTDDLAELATAVLPAWPAAQRDRLARRLHADTAGRPLLAVEMLHALALGADLAGAWPAPERTMEQTFPGDIPGPVVVAIRVGVRALPALEQDLLGWIAARGPHLPGREVARLAEGEPAVIHAALDRLEWAGWVVAGGRGYAVASRVVQDVFLTDLLTPGQVRRYKEA